MLAVGWHPEKKLKAFSWSKMVCQRKRFKNSTCAILGVACLVFLFNDSFAGTAADVFREDGFVCPDVRIEMLSRQKDYRLRDTTPLLRGQHYDNYQNHVVLAINRMKYGDFSDAVIADLDFTLARWPNHYRAMQLLIDYEANGGRANKFIQVPCYFQRAHWFVPDDENVLVLFGIYQRKLRKYEGAERAWKYALVIEEGSVEAHYNLGLLYFSLGRFQAAVHHAHKAYELGYPLQGLKRKLVTAGHWKQQPPE